MKTNEFPSLSSNEFIIVEMLIERGEMFGLEMIEHSHGKLKKGSIYVTLGRMEQKGLLASKEIARKNNEFGNNRRIYIPTERGKRIFRAQEIAINFLNMGSF
ncbi:MAG: PadR family transcriptional regulator [Pyrinomonadaceae bacterium]